jgi:hypothetical protein
VGQDEDPHPLMRRADFCRAEQARRRRVTQSPKLSQDGLEAEADVPGDVLNEDPLGAAFGDDTGNLRPEVTGIVGTGALACRAEGLAGISGEDRVEGASEASSAEAAQVIPDRGWGEISRALGSDEHGPWPFFPFNKGAGVIAWLGEHEAQIQASAACAEGQSVPGT